MSDELNQLRSENRNLKAKVARLEKQLANFLPKDLSDLSRIKVALVEDDSNLMELYREYMDPCGFDLFFCADGSDLAFHLFNGLAPNAIILDLNMPKISGFDILKGFHELAALAKVPILVVSGFIDKETKKLLDQQKIPYFEKPISIQKVIEFINTNVPMATSRRIG